MKQTSCGILFGCAGYPAFASHSAFGLSLYPHGQRKRWRLVARQDVRQVGPGNPKPSRPKCLAPAGVCDDLAKHAPSSRTENLLPSTTLFSMCEKFSFSGSTGAHEHRINAV